MKKVKTLCSLILFSYLCLTSCSDENFEFEVRELETIRVIGDFIVLMDNYDFSTVTFKYEERWFKMEYEEFINTNPKPVLVTLYKNKRYNNIQLKK